LKELEEKKTGQNLSWLDDFNPKLEELEKKIEMLEKKSEKASILVNEYKKKLINEISSNSGYKAEELSKMDINSLKLINGTISKISGSMLTQNEEIDVERENKPAKKKMSRWEERIKEFRDSIK